MPLLDKAGVDEMTKIQPKGELRFRKGELRFRFAADKPTAQHFMQFVIVPQSAGARIVAARPDTPDTGDRRDLAS